MSQVDPQWEEWSRVREQLYQENKENLKKKAEREKQKEEEKKRRHAERYGDAKYVAGQIVGDWQISYVKTKIMGIRYYRVKSTKVIGRVADLPEDRIPVPDHRYRGGVNDDPTQGFTIMGIYHEQKGESLVPYYKVARWDTDQGKFTDFQRDESGNVKLFKVSEQRLTELVEEFRRKWK